MPQKRPRFQLTEEDDGSATVTASFSSDHHRFNIYTHGNTATISYEESMSWRGTIRVSEPGRQVWADVMNCDEVTEFLEDNGIDTLKRNI